MNVKQIILYAAATFLVAACGDTEFVDTDTLPVKSTCQKPYFSSDIRAVKDGAVVLNYDHNPFDYTIIQRDGSVVVSDTLSSVESYQSWSCLLNSSDEFFFYTKGEDESFMLAKYDQNSRLVYSRKYDACFNSYGKASLDDGRFALFNTDYYEPEACNRLMMRIIDKDGELKDYKVVLDFDFGDNYYFSIDGFSIYAYDDRFIFSEYNFMDDNISYQIIGADGSWINSGALYFVDSNIGKMITYDFKYVGGSLYALCLSQLPLDETPLKIIKMDKDGNQLFAADVPADELSQNITVNGDQLIVSGQKSIKSESDIEPKYEGGIFVIDNNDGSLKNSISLSYDGEAIPWAILPANDGGYDVFITRKKDVDKWVNNNNPSIFVYHTLDLLDLHVDHPKPHKP